MTGAAVERLAGPPSDRGQLDRPLDAGEVAVDLLQGDHSPAHGAVQLPPAEQAEVDLERWLLVGRSEVFPGGDAADGEPTAEPPGTDAEMAEVLHGVPGVDHLPVGHGPNS
jgi:hypothetical protein